MAFIHTLLPIVLTHIFACTGTTAAWPHHPSRQLDETNSTQTPFEFCEADCACEECALYLAEYQGTCTCTEQPDGSAVQTGTNTCLSCVNGTDVCYNFSNFTDTVEASAEDGTPGWDGFYQVCFTIEGDEFCTSTADQNAPSPAPCTVVVNGVECNDCTDLFSENENVFVLDCTNIVEGAFMTVTAEGELTGLIGIFEDAGVALVLSTISAELVGAEDEYPVCPGDPDFPADNTGDNTNSGTRSALGCAVVGVVSVVTTVLV